MMLITLFAFIFAILILVSLHELGHFLVARLFGVKVIRFSIGFGKPFFRKKINDTEWCLAPIPLGGYVKMVDTREGKVDDTDLPYAFDKQHPFKRILIVAAGPLTNLGLAVCFYALSFSLGVTEIKPVIGTVLPNTIAERAGFQAGENIISVNGETPKDFLDFYTQTVLALDNKNVSIKTQSATSQTQTRIIDKQTEQEAIAQLSRGENLGILPDRITQTIGYIDPKGAAFKSGLKEGDVILSANKNTITSWFELTKIIQKSPGKAIQLSVLRDGQTQDITLRPDSEEIRSDLPLIGKAGLAPQMDEAWRKRIRHHFQPSIAQSWSLAWKKTTDVSWLTLKFFGNMLIGQASLSHISGPVTIAEVAGKTASLGFKSYIEFLALISVSLGILNLLPIPVLDGGHLLYYAIEWVRGKPLSQRIQEMGLRIGISILILLMGLAFFNDFSRIFG